MSYTLLNPKGKSQDEMIQAVRKLIENCRFEFDREYTERLTALAFKEPDTEEEKATDTFTTKKLTTELKIERKHAKFAACVLGKMKESKIHYDFDQLLLGAFLRDGSRKTLVDKIDEPVDPRLDQAVAIITFNKKNKKADKETIVDLVTAALFHKDGGCELIDEIVGLEIANKTGQEFVEKSEQIKKKVATARKKAEKFAVACLKNKSDISAEQLKTEIKNGKAKIREAFEEAGKTKGENPATNAMGAGCSTKK